MSAGTNPLEGRYRRLLLAYPRRYRRVRGLEMLTMLLDDAEAGRTRPTLAETADLVLGGLRCRLRPPGGRGVRILAIFLAFTGAALGAIGGTWVGWSSAAPLPADIRGVTIVLTAINDPRTGEPDADVERSFGDIPRATVGRDDRAIDWAAADIRSRDPGATVAKASRNLATAGWQVHSTRPDQINATKGDVTVQVWTEDQTVWFSFKRRQPLAVPLLAITGALMGGLLAWQLTCWASRRTLAGPFLGHSITVALAAVGLIVLDPLLASYCAALVVDHLPVHPVPTPALLSPADPLMVAVTAAGVVAELAALLLAALTTTNEPPRQPTRRLRDAAPS
jgi:hypothetical protein